MPKKKLDFVVKRKILCNFVVYKLKYFSYFFLTVIHRIRIFSSGIVIFRSLSFHEVNQSLNCEIKFY